MEKIENTKLRELYLEQKLSIKKIATLLKHSCETIRLALMENDIPKRNRVGENNSFFGKHHSEKVKERMRKAKLGKKSTQKTKDKISKAFTGRTLSESHKRKIGLGNIGKFVSEETRKAQGEWRSKNFRGENNPNWRGELATTPRNELIRASIEYRLWREAVFARDNWMCQECGARSGNGIRIYLQAHHIKSFAKHPELRFAIDNGVTLCIECHKAMRRKK